MRACGWVLCTVRDGVSERHAQLPHGLESRLNPACNESLLLVPVHCLHRSLTESLGLGHRSTVAPRTLHSNDASIERCNTMTCDAPAVPRSDGCDGVAKDMYARVLARVLSLPVEHVNHRTHVGRKVMHAPPRI
jgi:hypothetical protein